MTQFKLLLIIPLLIFSLNSYAQARNKNTSCAFLLDKQFVTDGMDHQLLLKPNKYNRLNVVFYPRFKYRLVVCNANKTLPIEWRLLDQNGLECFVNTDKNYVRSWDFQFTSIMNGIIEFKLVNQIPQEDVINLIVGYQIIEKNTTTRQ